MKNDDLISRQAAIKAIEDLQDCYNGFSDTFDKACIIGVLEEVPSVQPERRWISVTERLPEHLTSVIVHRKDGGIFMWEYFDTSPTDECWIDDSMNVYSFYDVTHWMPLPKPPMEEEET